MLFSRITCWSGWLTRATPAFRNPGVLQRHRAQRAGPGQPQRFEKGALYPYVRYYPTPKEIESRMQLRKTAIGEITEEKDTQATAIASMKKVPSAVKPSMSKRGVASQKKQQKENGPSSGPSSESFSEDLKSLGCGPARSLMSQLYWSVKRDLTKRDAGLPRELPSSGIHADIDE